MAFNKDFNNFQSNLKKLELIAKGHRSYVYRAVYCGKTVAIKVERKDISSFNHIKNEIQWLKILNRLGIGPKLIITGKDFFVCEYLSGEQFVDCAKNLPLTKVKALIKNILLQCRKLDELNVTKEEMHRPVKHIFVVKKGPVMIDFERCHYSLKPKNVTQFCQFLTSKKFQTILSNKGLKFNNIEIIKTVSDYKKSYSKKAFNKLLKSLSL